MCMFCLFIANAALEPFKRDNISETILRRLLNQDIFRHAKSKSKDKNDPTNYIFNQGKAVDFFVLILEGRVEVTVGKESLIYEGGPFTHFGLQALAPTVGIESPAQQFGSSQGVRGSLQSLNMENILVSVRCFYIIALINFKTYLLSPFHPNSVTRSFPTTQWRRSQMSYIWQWNDRYIWQQSEPLSWSSHVVAAIIASHSMMRLKR